MDSSAWTTTACRSAKRWAPRAVFQPRTSLFWTCSSKQDPQRAADSSTYQRIHIHLHSARIRSPEKWFFDRVADPYVTVETVGPDTGSTDYFDIGKQTFPVLPDCEKPVWDAKGTVIAKKGAGKTEALKFTLLDSNKGGGKNDKVLMEFLLPVEDLPEPCQETLDQPGAYTKFVRHHADDPDLELVFSIKVTENWLVTPEDTAALRGDTEQLAYTEQVLSSVDSETPDDMALLQCWKHKEEGACNGAVLWILGRNDCFMHPHVARALFWNPSNSEKRYDLYVLNYSMNGCCRRQGWVRDAHLNSHNKYGDFNRYNDQIAQALSIIKGGGDYETVLGYAHSTGGPVLLNYLMECGDDDNAFDGFIFNSPFLDWGFVGGDLTELILEHVGFMEKLGMLSMDKKLGVAVTPEELKDTPVRYLGQDIVLCSWSAKIWSQYHFDFDTRPLYKVPMTGGFAKGVTAVHVKLEGRHKQKKIVTAKPFLCITSRGDDVLKAAETTSRADWIGPNRDEVELNDNGHDVFLSQDCGDTAMAIDMVKCWMKGKGFL